MANLRITPWRKAIQGGPALTKPSAPWNQRFPSVVPAREMWPPRLPSWRAEFDEHLECEDHIRLWAVPVSRFGLTARDLVFVLIGLSMILAAFQLQADQARGLAGVLQALERIPLGWVVLSAAALGLAAFGVFGLIEAMYRRIDVTDID